MAPGPGNEKEKEVPSMMEDDTGERQKKRGNVDSSANNCVPTEGFETESEYEEAGERRRRRIDFFLCRFIFFGRR